MSRLSIAIVFSIGIAGVRGVVRRSEQAAFLAGKRDEDQRAREARRAASMAARGHLDDRRRA